MIALCARLAIFVGLAMSGHLKADLTHARLVEALPAGSVSYTHLRAHET